MWVRGHWAREPSASKSFLPARPRLDDRERFVRLFHTNFEASKQTQTLSRLRAVVKTKPDS